MTDRRDDIGSKVITGVLVGVIMLGTTMFVHAAWSTANEGKTKAYEISDRMTAMETRFSSFQSDLTEIKGLLRRGIPTSFVGRDN